MVGRGTSCRSEPAWKMNSAGVTVRERAWRSRQELKCGDRGLWAGRGGWWAGPPGPHRPCAYPHRAPLGGHLRPTQPTFPHEEPPAPPRPTRPLGRGTERLVFESHACLPGERKPMALPGLCWAGSLISLHFPLGSQPCCNRVGGAARGICGNVPCPRSVCRSPAHHLPAASPQPPLHSGD